MELPWITKTYYYQDYKLVALQVADFARRGNERTRELPIDFMEQTTEMVEEAIKQTILYLEATEQEKPYRCKHGIYDFQDEVGCGYCENENLARYERRIPNEELDDFPPEGYY